MSSIKVRVTFVSLFAATSLIAASVPAVAYESVGPKPQQCYALWMGIRTNSGQLQEHRENGNYWASYPGSSYDRVSYTDVHGTNWSAWTHGTFSKAQGFCY